MRRRILCQFLFYHLDRLLELRIMAGDDEVRPRVHVYVRRDALVLYDPFALSILHSPEGDGGRGHETVIDHPESDRDSYQSAPGPLAYQRADLRFAKVIWKGVAA